MSRKLLSALAVCGIAGALGLASTPTNADVIYTFSASGSDSGGVGTDSATATFDFSSANAFTLKLDNTTASIQDIGAVLDGFNFNLSGSITGITLTQINTPDGVATISCISPPHTGCTVSDTSPGSQTLTDWTAALSSSTVSMLADGQLHPYGIVNDSIDSNAGLDGLSNDQHNPYLEGPVTFTFTTTGETVIPAVSNTAFQFGTTAGTNDFDGTCTSTNNCLPPGGGGGQGTDVPEPSPLAVMGMGLLALAFLGLRKRFQNEPTRSV